MTKETEALKLARRMGKQELTEASREALQIASIIACRDALDAQPVPRRWVGLTNDEVNNFAAGCHLGKSVQGAIYEAEAKLKEKNT
jgi:hypothetical protein